MHILQVFAYRSAPILVKMAVGIHRCRNRFVSHPGPNFFQGDSLIDAMTKKIIWEETQNSCNMI